jgi:hypothetical protein
MFLSYRRPLYQILWVNDMKLERIQQRCVWLKFVLIIIFLFKGVHLHPE